MKYRKEAEHNLKVIKSLLKVYLPGSGKLFTQLENFINRSKIDENDDERDWTTLQNELKMILTVYKDQNKYIDQLESENFKLKKALSAKNNEPEVR